MDNIRRLHNEDAFVFRFAFLCLGLCLADRGFGLTEPRAADHFILRRVIAKIGFDPGAHSFDLFPHDKIQRVALVARVGQFRLKGSDLG